MDVLTRYPFLQGDEDLQITVDTTKDDWEISLRFDGESDLDLLNQLKQVRELQFLAIRAQSFSAPMQAWVDSLYDQPQTLIAYLLEIKQTETKTLNRAKVMVVGDHQVGKTSLIKRLSGRGFDRRGTRNKAIDIQQQRLSNGTEISIWDFPGKDIVQQCHRYFMTLGGLYLLVDDGNGENSEQRIGYWLRLIKSVAGDQAPILLIINKCDRDQGFSLDAQALQAEFNLVRVMYTSAQFDEFNYPAQPSYIPHRIDEVLLEIENQLAILPSVAIPVPNTWLAVLARLQDPSEHWPEFFTKTEFNQLCIEQQITDPRSQQLLSALLAQIGIVVSFEHNLGLTEIVNPLWVSEGVYQLACSPLLRANDGILNKHHFHEIFARDIRYQKSKDYYWLKQLLVKFELAFEIQGERLLLPGLLKSRSSQLKWQPFADGLSFVFAYEDLPSSVIIRLIVALYQYIDQEALQLWSTGVVLVHGNARAVIEANLSKHKIHIEINQDSKAGRDLLTVIRGQLRRINEHLLVADELIPLRLNGKPCGFFEDYFRLLAAEQREEQQIHCQVSQDHQFRGFDVKQLLESYRINEQLRFDFSHLLTDLYEIGCLEAHDSGALFQASAIQINQRFKQGLDNRGYMVAFSRCKQQLLVKGETGSTQCVIHSLMIDQRARPFDLSIPPQSAEWVNTVILVYVKSAERLLLWQNYQKQFDRFTDQMDRHPNPAVYEGESLSGGDKRYKLTHFFIDCYCENLADLN